MAEKPKVFFALVFFVFEKNNKNMDKQLIEILSRNGAIIHQLIVIEGANAQVSYSAPAKARPVSNEIDEDMLAEALSKHKELFRSGSWAVVYCVCRDLYHFINKVAFENMAARVAAKVGIDAPGKGTIQKSIENNGFMSKPVAKWKVEGNNRMKLDLGYALLEELGNEHRLE